MSGSDPFDYDHGMPEPCLVLDYRPIQRDPSERWQHLAKPPIPPLARPLDLDPATGQRRVGK